MKSGEFKGISKHSSTVELEIKRKLDYNPETGDFTWKKVDATNHSDLTYNAKYAGKLAGSVFKSDPSVGYVQIKLCGKTMFGHRIAWFLHYGEWPSKPLDHIDRDRSNNAISNLRLSCSLHNQRNRGLSRNNTSGVTGVTRQKNIGRWRAAIGVRGKTIVLGSFGNFFDAVAARKSAEVFYGFDPKHGSRTNTYSS